MSVNRKITSDSEDSARERRRQHLLDEANQQPDESAKELERRDQENTEFSGHLDEDFALRGNLAADLAAAREEIGVLQRAYANLTFARDRSEEDMMATQSVLRNLASTQRDRLEKQRNRLAKQKDRLAELNARAKTQEQRIEKLAQKMKAQRECINNLMSSIRDFKQINEIIMKNEAKNISAIQMLTEKNSNKQAKINELRDKNSRKQEKVDELRRENADRDHRLSNLRDKNQSTQAKLIEFRNLNSVRQKRIEDFHSMLCAEREQRAAMLASARWKAGELIAEIRRRPALGTLKLPARLLRLALGRQ